MYDISLNENIDCNLCLEKEYETIIPLTNKVESTFEVDCFFDNVFNLLTYSHINILQLISIFNALDVHASYDESYECVTRSSLFFINKKTADLNIDINRSFCLFLNKVIELSLKIKLDKLTYRPFEIKFKELYSNILSKQLLVNSNYMIEKSDQIAEEIIRLLSIGNKLFYINNKFIIIKL